MEISTAIASSKAALDLIKTGLKARDDAMVRSAMLDLTDRLAAMSQLALEQLERNADLIAQNAELRSANQAQQKKVDNLEQQAMDRRGYSLHELRPGAFAYRSDKFQRPLLEPQHDLCQTCFDSGKKAVLVRSENSAGYWEWTCPLCKWNVWSDTPARDG